MIGRGRKCGRKQSVWIRMSRNGSCQTQHTSEQRISTHSFLLASAGDGVAGSSRRLVLHESPNTTISVIWRFQTFFARVIGWYEGRFQATNSRAEIASSTTTLRRAKSFILSFVSELLSGVVGFFGSVYRAKMLVVDSCLNPRAIESILF
jgi:hypothetical protein